MNKNFAILAVLILASLVLSDCAAPATPIGTEPSESTAPTEVPATGPPAPEFFAPKGALVAFPANAAPTLDGVADDAAWAWLSSKTLKCVMPSEPARHPSSSCRSRKLNALLRTRLLDMAS